LLDADRPAEQHLEHAEAQRDREDRPELLDPEQQDLDETVAGLVVGVRVEHGPPAREALEQVAEELPEHEAPHDRPGRAPHDHGADGSQRSGGDRDAKRPEAQGLALLAAAPEQQRQDREQEAEAHVADDHAEVEREEDRQRPARVEAAVLGRSEERQQALEGPHPRRVVELDGDAGVVVLVGRPPGGGDVAAELVLEAAQHVLALRRRHPALQGEAVAALEQVLARRHALADVAGVQVELREALAVLGGELAQVLLDGREAPRHDLRALLHRVRRLRDALVLVTLGQLQLRDAGARQGGTERGRLAAHHGDHYERLTAVRAPGQDEALAELAPQLGLEVLEVRLGREEGDPREVAGRLDLRQHRRQVAHQRQVRLDQLELVAQLRALGHEPVDLLPHLADLRLGGGGVGDGGGAGDLRGVEAQDVEQRGRPGEHALPGLALGERGALEPHARQGALLLVRRERHDLHDPEGLQGCQHVPGDGAATDDGHLVHRGDHGKIFSSTMAAAAARFAATLAERASAVSFAAERTLCLTASSSLRPASASDWARASALARAASRVAAASAFALSMTAFALAWASSTLLTSFFSWASRSCSSRSPCASKRPSLLKRPAIGAPWRKRWSVSGGHRKGRSCLCERPRRCSGQT